VKKQGFYKSFICVIEGNGGRIELGNPIGVAQRKLYLLNQIKLGV